MRVGALVLDQANQYLVEGKLPSKPEWDKEWLKYLCEKAFGITYSPSTAKDLPLWARKPNYDWDLNLGIDTLKSKPAILFITRGTSNGNGKEFRLDEWKKVEVEVWIQK